VSAVSDRDTDALIERLAREAKPVKPLMGPLWRGGIFVAAVLAAMTALVVWGGHPEETLSHLLEMPFAIELAGAALAGIAAIVAAVVIAIPGRSAAWIYLPVPGVLLWLVGGGLECYQALAAGFEVQSLLQSRDCFFFIAGAGLPVAGAAYFLLRRTVPMQLLPVTALAGLGAALLAAALLQFMHAHGTNPIDFASHVAAVAAVMLFMIVLGRAGLKRA
jgi:hypothetical protein